MAKESVVPTNIEEKAEVAQFELQRDASPEVAIKPGDAFGEADARGQHESGFESLSAWETIKTFKRASLYCFMVTFAAATDGYQVSTSPFFMNCLGLILSTDQHERKYRRKQSVCPQAWRGDPHQLTPASWLSETIRHDCQRCGPTRPVSFGIDRYWYDSVRRPDHCHGLYSIVRLGAIEATVRLAC